VRPCVAENLPSGRKVTSLQCRELLSIVEVCLLY
jgi:hypothetical protein